MENVLIVELQELLEDIGDSFESEQEIFDLVMANAKQPVIIKEAFKRKNLKLNDFPALEIAKFYKAMIDKIIGMKDAEGYYKKTRNTENMLLPNYTEIFELQELLEKSYNAKSDTTKRKYEAEIEKMVWSITKLDKDSLNQWEQKLVAEQVVQATIDVLQTSMGKS